MSYIFTSESVSEGHPDKVCDQISDAILDAYLKEDPNSRVACETLIKNNMVVVAGEITSAGAPNLEPIIRNVINEIGYNDDQLGFNGSNCEIQNFIFQQSPDIAQGVNEGEGENLEQGADYLIITKNEFVEELIPFVNWKIEKGNDSETFSK